MAELEGKVALITGSISGIGKAIAEKYASDGCSVVINSFIEPERGHALVETLPDAIYVQADVSTKQGADALVDAALERWGRVDIVVNNAGTTKEIPHSDLDAVTGEVWDHILKLNVVGAWYMAQSAAPHLTATGDGSIVNIASVAGIRPMGSSIPYGVSKAALAHMTVMLASTMGPEVRVNAIAPGVVDTTFLSQATYSTLVDNAHNLAPLARVAQPSEIAHAAHFLVTASYTTGTVLPVDGGLHLR